MSYDLRNLSLEFLRRMTPDQAREYFPYGDSISYRQLVANIIVAATALRWDETRGVREFWYNPIKPIVLRLFPEVIEAGGNDRKYSQYDAVLSDLAKSSEIKYSDLGIVDFRTMRELYESMDGANCWGNVILFVEKDSAYVHLRPLKELLNITILSGGGWSKTGAAEAAIANLDRDREYMIYIVSDHDPYGIGIGEEAVSKLVTLGLPVKEHHRIAISPDQLSEEVRESQKYPVKMTLKNAPRWCEENGLEGPYQKIYKTVTEKGVKKRFLVYEGTKCYGLEIEAVSGQPGGPKLLRSIVLRELLEHLEEYDRIWEITGPLWEDMPEKVIRYYLDEETLKFWHEHPHVEYLTDYVTPEEYVRREENILELKEEATLELNVDLEYAEEGLSKAIRSRDEKVARKYVEYQVEINKLYEEHIRPLEERRDEEIEVIKNRDSEDVDFWQGRVSSLEAQIYDIEEPYEELASELESNYHKSRSIYAQAHYLWLKGNIQRYVDLAPGTEVLSFGLMKGCLLEALDEGETVSDLIGKAVTWDEEQACNYIGEDIDRDADIMGEIFEILEKMREEAFGLG